MAMPRHNSAPSLVRAFLFFSIAFLQVATAASAPALQAENKPAAETPGANPHPVLLELFTSEGCSSCPPADVLLKKLDAGQPIPGARLIVLSEHVTYWDHDGWKDPNSSSSLTDRQSSYESALGVKTLYTPQMIVDGTQEMRLSDPQQIKDSLEKAAATPKVLVRIGEVTVDPGNPTVLRARIETDVNFEKHNADMYVAVALDHVESQVLRGENGGKHLVHVAVVQELAKVGKLPKGKSFAQDVQLKLKPGTDPKNIRLVALVQESGPGKVLGAALWTP
ncbi:MAG: DUF1223 domain-containing protein [Candidatus Sulfotelmatobacter sp.]